MKLGMRIIYRRTRKTLKKCDDAVEGDYLREDSKTLMNCRNTGEETDEYD